MSLLRESIFLRRHQLGDPSKPVWNRQEDEMAAILQTNWSPISGVKSTSSPNGKRVSPNIGLGMFSPGQSSSWKLLLRSIPSFPSLTPSIDVGMLSDKLQRETLQIIQE